MKADIQTEAEVLDSLYKVAEAYERRDMEGVLSHFAPDPDVIMLGTGVDEKRVGLEEIESQLRRDWAQAEGVSMDIGWVSVASSGPVAWLAADLTFTIRLGKRDIAIPGRLTGVLEKRNGRWLWVQWHSSLPAAEQDEGQSFPSLD